MRVMRGEFSEEILHVAFPAVFAVMVGRKGLILRWRQELLRSGVGWDAAGAAGVMFNVRG